jgi:polyhydroxyalkanoate synthesis regulator phasin
MLDFVKKSLLAGIGFTSLAEEKVRKVVDTWIEKGELTEEEGKKLFREIVDKGKKNIEELEEKIAKEVSKLLKKANLATREEIDKLNEKVDKLSEKIKE